MRIVRVSASDQPTYGILGDASKRVIALTGDPLFHKVEQSGQFFELEDVRLLSPVIPRSKALVLDPVGVAGDVAAQHVTLIPNTAIAGPDDPIVFPAWAHEVTVEPALAIVVKTLVKDVSPAAARTLILGTCLAARFRASGVDDFVQTMAKGYDTQLSEEGARLSAGQKQLVTIARAFLADPQILILDEATSSVDTRTEILVQQAMERLRSGRTSFVIAHRLSTIRDADVIIVMQHGDVVEQGTHQQLLAAGGAYAQLYNAQFAETEA